MHFKIVRLVICALVLALLPLSSSKECRSSGICSWSLGLGNKMIDPMSLPEGSSNSYIIKCLSADGCGELARALVKVIGDSSDLTLMRGLGLLSGRLDSSVIKMLCKSSELQRLIQAVELDQVVGYDSIVA